MEGDTNGWINSEKEFVPGAVDSYKLDFVEVVAIENGSHNFADLVQECQMIERKPGAFHQIQFITTKLGFDKVSWG